MAFDDNQLAVYSLRGDHLGKNDPFLNRPRDLQTMFGSFEFPQDRLPVSPEGSGALQPIFGRFELDVQTRLDIRCQPLRTLIPVVRALVPPPPANVLGGHPNQPRTVGERRPCWEICTAQGIEVV